MSDINAQLQDILAQLQSLSERVALIEARQMLVPDIERYGKLQQFLAEGNFREADAETLRVILEAAGRTRDTLTPEDMMRFPVNVIRVLDRLWKNYSGDHFGFSAQVKLYFAVGGSINTLRTQDAETIRKFGELVGWRDKDEWRIDDYDHWDFSLAAPQGCFPALWWKSPYGLKMVTFCFTRLIECDL
ncbi:MAG: GUN4 domain-containing protein [Microcystis wesenbergii TW10]|jgi:hypothetical protein|uniref:GUN4 domain-containing protein n=3 Tax=Microcystis TaxID=1125 RepID=A0A552ALP3_MICAE|nr:MULTISPECIES: GUN4 domain-containing protein [Microcystis]REJ53194.1 MAG: GUN4 domain-containing protein [Microcystis wesenbergii TW10]TRT86373.1 MAG: GUN4 domain-containing protein [Microcystis aeruginosa Ma_OC_H_19870700_S124]MCZ8040822.1 GUN4 domain-containing protein [Microcystis sp. LE17-20A]MCZ8213896.1 GUN4 domain-containing protein [Microcystis sp. LE19-8.1F]MDT3674848.1 GUN4 domain-containing protein [Microcystis wesenbergii NRERC-220]